jgi:4-alpha-glucanotransferase
MKRLRLVVGTHNHVPVGQPEPLCESAYQRSYRPFLSTLYNYPEIPATLHYGGNLLEWLEQAHPEFLMLLSEMVKRGQVELLGGGFYDPILSLIPNSDKLGQLEKMNTFLRVQFGIRPRGCWIAELAWEPTLASVIRTSGMDYTFLEDWQLRCAGVVQDAHRPYLTEDQGKLLTLFPIDTALSGDPHKPPEDIVGALRRLLDEGDQEMTALIWDGASIREPLRAEVSSDAEAGTSGAETGRSAEGPPEHWVDRFFRALRENAEWILPSLPGDLRPHRSPDRIYVPTCAPKRVAASALPFDLRSGFTTAAEETERGGPCPSGSFFRQFLTRYPESALLYAKMMFTHLLVGQVRGDKYQKKAAQNELWKGQCHAAYWYGAPRSLGIYANHLRKAAYRSLIEAERITREKEIFIPSIIAVDYDMDEVQEYLYQGSEINAYLHTQGGALFELDFLPSSWNYMDTMARRREDAPDADGIGDRYCRRCFLDHFLTRDCSIESLDDMSYREAGDFLSSAYELVELNRPLPEVLLRREGSVDTGGDGRAPLTMEKRYIFRPRSIDVYYRLTNPGVTALETRFAVELNLSLSSRSTEAGRLFLLEENRKTEIPAARGAAENVKSLLVRDVLNGVSVTLSCSGEFLLWVLPVETRVGTTDGEETVFQSHCLMPQWPLAIPAGGTWENHLSIAFEKSSAPSSQPAAEV